MTDDPPNGAPNTTSDALAAVARKLIVGGGTVPGTETFTGWFDYDGTAATFRLYLDLRFTEWYEIPIGALLQRVDPSARPDDEGRSRIWIAADAPITWCQSQTQSGPASDFAHAGLQGGTSDIDPAGYGSGSGKK